MDIGRVVRRVTKLPRPTPIKLPKPVPAPAPVPATIPAPVPVVPNGDKKGGTRWWWTTSRSSRWGWLTTGCILRNATLNGMRSTPHSSAGWPTACRQPRSREKAGHLCRHIWRSVAVYGGVLPYVPGRSRPGRRDRGRDKGVAHYLRPRDRRGPPCTTSPAWSLPATRPAIPRSGKSCAGRVR